MSCLSALLKSIRTALSIVAVLALASCAAVTSYGEKPRQDALDPNKFAFSVYFNSFSQKYDIEQNAKAQAKEFAEKNGYRTFEVTNVDCVATVKNKCIYEIRFAR